MQFHKPNMYNISVRFLPADALWGGENKGKREAKKAVDLVCPAPGGPSNTHS